MTGIQASSVRLVAWCTAVWLTSSKELEDTVRRSIVTRCGIGIGTT